MVSIDQFRLSSSSNTKYCLSNFFYVWVIDNSKSIKKSIKMLMPSG